MYILYNYLRQYGGYIFENIIHKMRRKWRGSAHPKLELHRAALQIAEIRRNLNFGMTVAGSKPLARGAKRFAPEAVHSQLAAIAASLPKSDVLCMVAREPPNPELTLREEQILGRLPSIAALSTAWGHSADHVAFTKRARMPKVW